MDKIEQAKPTKEYVEAAMKYVEEKIAKTTAKGSWKGVDVDEFLDEMRGREPDDDDLAKEINAIHERYPEISFAKLSRICVRIANWQKKQIMKEKNLTKEETVSYLKAYLDGDIEVGNIVSLRQLIQSAIRIIEGMKKSAADRDEHGNDLS